MWHFGDSPQTFRSGRSYFSTRGHGAVCPGTRGTLRTKGELGSCINVTVPVTDMVPVGTMLKTLLKVTNRIAAWQPYRLRIVS